MAHNLTQTIHKYADDITEIPKVLERKLAEHERAQVDVDAVLRRIHALVPRYRAALGGRQEEVDMRALAALAEEHHKDTILLERAEQRANRLMPAIRELQALAADQGFQRALGQVTTRTHILADEEAEAGRVWARDQTRALSELPRNMTLEHREDYYSCPRLRPEDIRVGRWLMASPSQGGDTRTMTHIHCTPVYVLMESRVGAPEPDDHHRHRFFYVWDHAVPGKEICRVSEFDFRGIPAQEEMHCDSAWHAPADRWRGSPARHWR